MGYKSYPATEAQKLCAEYKKKAGEFEQLKKSKGDKNKIKEAEKEVDLLGKKIAQKLEGDITAVASSFKGHAVKVDTALTDMIKEYKLGEAGLKAFEKNPDMRTNQKLFDVAAKTGERMKRVYDAAKQDANEFGKSWFEYREFNPTNAYKIDKKYTAKFSATVGKIMNEQKPFTSKLQKMEVMIKQGETLADRARTAVNAALGATNAGKKESEKLAQNTGKILNDMINKKGTNYAVVEQAEKTIGSMMKSNPKGTPDVIRNSDSLQKNAIAGHKYLQTGWRAIEKLTKAAEATLGKSTDTDIAKNYKQAKSDEAAAKKLYEDATTIMKRLVPVYGEYRKKVIKGGVKV